MVMSLLREFGGSRDNGDVGGAELSFGQDFGGFGRGDSTPDIPSGVDYGDVGVIMNPNGTPSGGAGVGAVASPTLGRDVYSFLNDTLGNETIAKMGGNLADRGPLGWASAAATLASGNPLAIGSLGASLAGEKTLGGILGLVGAAQSGNVGGIISGIGGLADSPELSKVGQVVNFASNPTLAGGLSTAGSVLENKDLSKLGSVARFAEHPTTAGAFNTAGNVLENKDLSTIGGGLNLINNLSSDKPNYPAALSTADNLYKSSPSFGGGISNLINSITGSKESTPTSGGGSGESYSDYNASNEYDNGYDSGGSGDDSDVGRSTFDDFNLYNPSSETPAQNNPSAYVADSSPTETENTVSTTTPDIDYTSGGYDDDFNYGAPNPGENGNDTVTPDIDYTSGGYDDDFNYGAPNPGENGNDTDTGSTTTAPDIDYTSGGYDDDFNYGAPGGGDVGVILNPDGTASGGNGTGAVVGTGGDASGGSDSGGGNSGGSGGSGGTDTSRNNIDWGALLGLLALSGQQQVPSENQLAAIPDFDINKLKLNLNHKPQQNKQSQLDQLLSILQSRG